MDLTCGRSHLLGFFVLLAALAFSDAQTTTSAGLCPPLGVQNRSIIPDGLMTATSAAAGSEAYRARLNGDGAWQPTGQVASNFLAIDLQYPRYICSIQTQGQGGGYVETYMIVFQQDNNSSFFLYSEDGGNAKTFTGNNDNETVVQQDFSSYIYAQFILINPQTFSGAPRLRIELLGVDALPTITTTATTPTATTSSATTPLDTTTSPVTSPLNTNYSVTTPHSTTTSQVTITANAVTSSEAIQLNTTTVQVTTPLPVTTQVNTTSPITTQVDTTSPITTQVNTTSPITTQVNTTSPVTTQVDTTSQ
ncbi:adipocyte enhancer-binding protein 1-like [Branchiostoma floridae x Branchiostoma belcheri]